MAPKRKAAEALAEPVNKKSKQTSAAVAPQVSPKREAEESLASPASKRSRRGNDTAIEQVVTSIEVDLPVNLTG